MGTVTGNMRCDKKSKKLQYIYKSNIISLYVLKMFLQRTFLMSLDHAILVRQNGRTINVKTNLSFVNI